MNYFPIFASLKNRPVLVVGAGEVAYRKIELLCQAGAQIKIIAQHLGVEVQALVDEGKASWWKKEFQDNDVNQAVLTIAATNNADLNQQVALAGETYLRLVNVVDDPTLCQFIVPAIVDRSPVQIAISTGGAAPVLARQIRQKLEQELPQHLGAMAQLAQRFRSKVKTQLTTLLARRLFWERLFNQPKFSHLVAQAQWDAASAHLLSELDQASLQTPQGLVSLVGAGPGDAGLLSLKGYQALQAADVVLYDALVGPGVLDLIRRDAQRIAVGKRAHHPSVPQEETNRLLLHYAQQGLRVVRLKGGDPFVFGRGAEEVEVLQKAGVDYQVIPGVTAALGATAAAGIPLTHRSYAQSVVMVTGHCRPDGHEVNWACLAQERQTVVIYMGTIKATEISAKLMAHGRAGSTPIAIISQGTLATQTVARGQLSELPQLAQAAQRPALIVIGEVAQLDLATTPQ
ncbi:siroheme synthase CysG [Paenalcaligenes hominis]|uniref:siroheme synthase CysG n=1 Tax=Paenalcaligenes hominis TaxID=643674 RepID=UPI0035268E9A